MSGKHEDLVVLGKGEAPRLRRIEQHAAASETALYGGRDDADADGDVAPLARRRHDVPEGQLQAGQGVAFDGHEDELYTLGVEEDEEVDDQVPLEQNQQGDVQQGDELQDLAPRRVGRRDRAAAPGLGDAEDVQRERRDALGVGRRTSANSDLLIGGEGALRSVREHDEQDSVERERQQTKTEGKDNHIDHDRPGKEDQ